MSSFNPLGEDMFGEEIKPTKRSPVLDNFMIPPFSVLSARDGVWQERKRAWTGMGIKGEVGRGFNLMNYSKRISLGDLDTSIFDPVLCEVIYRWFSAPDSQILDPFAGGSVRGIVASQLGRKYWGGELRAEQVEANRTQAAAICGDTMPEWVTGDSRVTLADAPLSDLIFSCPPYGNLEVYSDDNAHDLSAMPHVSFCEAYRTIIAGAAERLKDNRFACFVVGDFRDSNGHYRNFVSETIAAFGAAGLQLYNEAILITSVGSASMRVSKQFRSGRKFAKTHQNILVFIKGDWRKANQYCGEIKGLY